MNGRADPLMTSEEQTVNIRSIPCYSMSSRNMEN